MICLIILEIGQNVCLDEISDEFEFESRGVKKTRSLGQIKEIPCGCSRGHIFCPSDLEIGQNVCLDVILDEYEFQSPVVLK